MSCRSYLSALFVALGLVSAAGSAETAADGGERFATQVRGLGWDGDSHYIEGFLTTKRDPDAFKCVMGRKILVRYLRTGKIVGSARSKSGDNFPGSFKVSLGRFAPVGTYRVIAKRKTMGSTVCRKGSNTIEQRFYEND